MIAAPPIAHLSIVTEPTTEPLTIAEVKAHLRLDTETGEPSPTAVTVALASPAVAGNVDNGAHRYLATFVTADGETEAGAISSAVTVADKTVNGKVELTAIPLGGSAVTSRKIYRTVAAGSTYLLLTTIANNTATVYTDNIADASLGAQAPTTNTTADPELVSWLIAARRHCEQFTERAFVTQTWDYLIDWRFPCGALVLPKPPLQTAVAPVVSYVDENGVTQTWNAALQRVIAPQGDTAAAGYIVPVYGEVYPSVRSVPSAVTVRFNAGYGAAAVVPAPIKAAMKLLIAHWYERRESAGDQLHDIPYGCESLLWPYRVFP